MRESVGIRERENMKSSKKTSCELYYIFGRLLNQFQSWNVVIDFFVLSKISSLS